MAKINLVRNIDPASAPLGGAHGILRDGFSAMRSASARERDAEDSLSRGLNHVGKVLLSIYDDMAAVRQRQEMLEGETAYFDIQEESNQKISRMLDSGEFDGAGGLDKFGDACRRIDSRRLSLLRERLRCAAGPEEAERIWNSGRAEFADGYAAEMFDVFALSAAAEAEKRAEREAGKTGEKRRRDLDAAARGKLDALSAKAAISRMEAKNAAYAFAGKRIPEIVDGALDREGYMGEVEAVLSGAQQWPEEKKTVERGRAPVAFEYNRERLGREVEAKFARQAQDALDRALEDGGFFPLENPDDWRYVDEKRRLYGSDGAAPTPAQIKARGENFVKTAREAVLYSGEGDYAGIGLARLAREAQCFPAGDALLLARVLGGARGGNLPNSKWSAHDMREFNRVFSEKCLVFPEKSLKSEETEETCADFLRLREGLLNSARVRGLTFGETLVELEKDPLFKRLGLR